MNWQTQKLKEESLLLKEEFDKKILNLLVKSLKEEKVLSFSVLESCPENGDPYREFRLRLTLRTRGANPDNSRGKGEEFVQTSED